jgi:hypothetical protein
MHEKREPLIEEESKHRKKSSAKGRARSKHKHVYETVLLTIDHHCKDLHNGNPKVMQRTVPTKVCIICGRIDEVDRDPSLYLERPFLDFPFKPYERVLSEKALGLPKWHAKDFWDAFAVKVDEGEKTE